MQSVQSKLFNGFLKLFNIKEIINKFLGKGKRRNRPFFSKRAIEKHSVSTVYIDHKEVSTLGNDRETQTHILYFHGGMYTIEANTGHKKWLELLFCDATRKGTPLFNISEAAVCLRSWKLILSNPDDTFSLRYFVLRLLPAIGVPIEEGNIRSCSIHLY